VLLTVAALVFIAAALFRTETALPEAPFDTARKPLPN
jgi:hypothetical protein